MKHCPRCQNQFRDELVFCDIDGTPLVEGLGARQNTPFIPGPMKSGSTTPAGVSALIGILIGIVLCALVYLAFLAPGLNPNEASNQQLETTVTATAPAPLDQRAAEPLPAPSPAVEESPSPEEADASAEASPAAATETSAKIAVNPGPISTGTTTIGEGRTLITMKDGSSVEADAAWEDAEGIWYRRSGLVSFVDRTKVEKISELSTRNSPAEARKPQ
jgi:hypothetical protein